LGGAFLASFSAALALKGGAAAENKLSNSDISISGGLHVDNFTQKINNRSRINAI
jgi:hypothetical protein